jgi:hypothetical protein
MLQKKPICVSTFGTLGESLQIEGGRLPVQWPSSVADNPLLRMLIQAGFATAKEVRNDNGIRQGYEVDLTPKGRKAQILDPLNGFCVATKRVAEVVRWTVPAPGQPVTVTYSWKIADPARWKNEPVFAQMLADMPGTKDAVEGLAVMQQMSDGWQVVMLE